ncbi:MAG: hypothetical protein FD149_1848 [Rhodospirillaceae bacterium]|nr:MAG: hypothetical protein FD149_1848 [Rhodospirillaceae bacterium]
MNEDEIRLSVAEAALRLGVSVDTIRRRIKTKDLKAQRDNTGKWWVLVPQGPGQDSGTAVPEGTHPLEPQARRDLFEVLKSENDRLWQALQAKDDLIRDLATKLAAATAVLMTSERTQIERDEARAQFHHLKALVGQMLAKMNQR